MLRRFFTRDAQNKNVLTSDGVWIVEVEFGSPGLDSGGKP